MDAAEEIPTASLTENKDDKEKTQPMGDEYDYINREHFTSEAFKIEIGNIPKYFGFGSNYLLSYSSLFCQIHKYLQKLLHFSGECKKLLKKKLQLNPHKIKHVPRVEKIYVTFRNEEDKSQALKRLHELVAKLKTAVTLCLTSFKVILAVQFSRFTFRGKVLQVKTAKPKQDAMALKRPHTEDRRNEAEPSKHRKIEASQCKDSMTPQGFKAVWCGVVLHCVFFLSNVII